MAFATFFHQQTYRRIPAEEHTTGSSGLELNIPREMLQTTCNSLWLYVAQNISARKQLIANMHGIKEKNDQLANLFS